MWLKIPFRNLSRNVRRTVLSLAIIGLGTAMTFVVLGFVYSSVDIIQDSLLGRYGNIQIARKKVWEENAKELSNPIRAGALSGLRDTLERIPEVEKVSTQISFTGLLLAGNSSKPVKFVGIDTENEVVSYGDSIARGENLSSASSDSVLVGESLASELGVNPGESVRLIVETEYSNRSTGSRVISGLYTAQSEEVEKRQVYMPISSAQKLVGKNVVGRLAIALKNRSSTDRVARNLRQNAGITSLSLGVRTWKQLSSFYKMLNSFFGLIFGFLVVVVSVLVFFIVLQVLTMSFLERTREVGTIRALGTRSGEVFRMFVSESFLLGLTGAVLGLGFGILLALGFNLLGINWTPPGSVEPVVLTVKIGWANVWPPVLISLVATVVSSFYPAYRTAGTDIVETLRVEE
jgi:putative ABC transport system permease protein